MRTQKLPVNEVLEILDSLFPNAKSDLDYRNNFELLIAVILSAQATDKSVNKVTPELFEHYPDADALSQAQTRDVIQIIKSIGLYATKAKNIIEASKILVDVYGGEVPSDFDALVSLPGVGRKTANVVRAVGFNIPAIAVDTHVHRVAIRLGWAKKDASVLEVEKALMKKIPKESWAKAHHLLLLFGRYYSTARDKRNIYDVLGEIKENQNETNDH
ncbi:endonuclease III [Erysipelothrix larvae]|uniref:Endonuclease III n=1 Tax=Erysipelothrix larvae TaxID=1514105 RepID=A0A120JTL2_9FIRM|nr:endonuclease III [Erysipelothrix larvae]AMC93210.1 endonuclease III [Erysipelothrix larvae]